MSNIFKVWNCPDVLEFQCPQVWESLSETSDKDVRYCDVCSQNVYRCSTPQEFIQNAKVGRCVAILNKFSRRPKDPDMFLGRPSQEMLREIKQQENLISEFIIWWNNILSAEPSLLCQWQLHSLTSLDLSENQLTSLPADLTSLDLSENQLTSLPAEIVQLHSLTSLNLFNNQLTSLPAEIGQLHSLTSLNLFNNQLTSLPAEIGQLHSLTSLYLGNNQLTSLPAEIGQLHSLTSLYLNDNQLTSLPAEIGQLHSLTSLYLGNNQLTSLPAEIGQLHSLQELYLGNNPIQDLSALANHPNLTSLDLSENQLTSLPVEIVQLHSLTSLDLSHNQLTSLPAEIVQLHSLTSLDLGNNPIQDLSALANHLDSTSLNLSHNQLTSLPAEIGQLHSLTRLNLSHNQLTSLPAEIVQLHYLQELNLEGNPIQDLSALFNHPNRYLKVRCFGIIKLPRRYWTHLNPWKAECLLTEKNAEIRRLLIQQIGYDRIIEELGAIELDQYREYTLLKIDADVDVEPIHLLKMTCPSTAYVHALRVPPDLTSARDAIRWVNWDIDPEDFAVET